MSLGILFLVIFFPFLQPIFVKIYDDNEDYYEFEKIANSDIFLIQNEIQNFSKENNPQIGNESRYFCFPGSILIFHRNPNEDINQIILRFNINSVFIKYYTLDIPDYFIIIIENHIIVGFFLSFENNSFFLTFF